VGLRGKRILVTGACSLIGEAIVRRLVSEGASVLGLSESKPHLKRLAADLGKGFEPITADIRGPDVILRLAKLGRFDALVCHADLAPETPKQGTHLPDLLQQQLFCAIHTIEGCGPSMRNAGHGHVLIIENLSHLQTAEAIPPAFHIWKGGYHALVKRWTSELDADGVKVTVIGLDEVETVSGNDRTASLSQSVAEAVCQTLDAPAHACVHMESQPRATTLA